MEQQSSNEELNLRILGELFSGLIHEISSPLSVVSFNLDKALKMLNSDETSKEEISKTLEKAIDSTQKILNIKESSTRFNKIIENEISVFLIKDILEDTISFLNDFGALEQIRVNYNVEDNLSIEGSYLKIQQVLINILINSKHALSDINERGIIDITSYTKDGFIHLTIEDNGDGVSIENVDNIFKKFFTTKKDQMGTGIGLYICSEIIQNHGGSIRYFESKYKGAGFDIVIPYLSNLTGELK